MAVTERSRYTRAKPQRCASRFSIDFRTVLTVRKDSFWGTNYDELVEIKRK